MSKTKTSNEQTKPKTKNVVIEEDLFNEIVQGAQYNESFSSVLKRKWRQSKTTLTPEQSDMEK